MEKHPAGCLNLLLLRNLKLRGGNFLSCAQQHSDSRLRDYIDGNSSSLILSRGLKCFELSKELFLVR